MKSFNDRLKEFILSKYKNISQFADAIGMNYQTVYGYVIGRTQPDINFLTILIEAGCNLNWLLSGEGDMYVHGHVNNRYIQELQEAIAQVGEVIDRYESKKLQNKKH